MMLKFLSVLVALTLPQSQANEINRSFKLAADFLGSVPALRECDLAYVSAGEIPTHPNLPDRAILLQRISAVVVPNHGRCILHYLDIGGDFSALTLYLTSAWKAGKQLGNNDFYLVKLDKALFRELSYSNFTTDVVVDFQNIQFAVPIVEGDKLYRIYMPNELIPDEPFREIGLWSEKRGLYNAEKNFESRYENFGAATVNVTHPDVLVVFAGRLTYPPNDTKVWSGADHYAAKYVAEALNFTLAPLHSIDGQFGSLVDKEKNLFNGMIGMCQRKEVFLAMGHITRTAIRSSAVDFSYPYFTTKVGMLTIKPVPLPKYLAIIWPYQPFVWASLAATVMFMGPVYWAFSKFGRIGYGIRFGFVDAVFQVSMALVLQGISIWPVSWHGRNLFTTWAVFSFIVAYAYSGGLMSCLTVPARTRPIDSFSQVADDDEIRVMARPYTSIVSFLTNPSNKDPVIRTIGTRMLDQGEEVSFKYKNYKGLLEITNADRAVFFTETGALKHVIKMTQTTASGASDFHFAKEGILPSWWAYAMRKRAPYRPAVNKWIRRFLQFGLYQKWIDMTDLDYKRNLLARRSQGLKVPTVELKFPENPGIEALVLDHLQGPFMLYLIAVAVAVAVMGCELFGSRGKKGGQNEGLMAF